VTTIAPGAGHRLIDLRYLDRGIIGPHIAAEADARQLVRACYFGPLGERFCTANRGADCNAGISDQAAYYPEPNADIGGVVGPPGRRVHQLRGRPRRDVEYFGQRQLAADPRRSAERNLRPRFGGLPPMSRTPARITMAPPRPGAFIREEILDELGLSVSEAAKVLDVRRATLSDLINDNAALSAEMALRIEKAFGMKMEMLLINMQAWHDAYAMRQREGEIAVKPYRPSAPGPG
jgi:antitoxin HigA-1